MQRKSNNKGFTLVEILIVVIILGILAAIVIPQFSNASTDAKKNSLTSQLQTIRSQLELYKLQHNDKLPPAFEAASGAVVTDWREMTTQTDVAGATNPATTVDRYGPYLQQEPSNPLNGHVGVYVGTADVTFGQTNPAGASGATNGFVMNKTTGKVWGTSAKAGRVFDESNPSNTQNDD